jgi:putative PLP-dependent aminotransferase (TIGR04422 family)
VTCYQWPIPQISTPFKNEYNEFDNLITKIDNIETYFEGIFSNKVVLMPSGRSCISAILKINKISRGDIVWAPKWSSHCVWNNISYFATPTINFKNTPKVYLNIHKWGHIHILKSERFNKNIDILIEDSVDSLIVNKNALFPNDGNYEVFSLTKIIGSYSGGLLLCKNKNDYVKAKELQYKNMRLGFEQSYLKYINCVKPEIINVSNNWHYREYENFSVDINSLDNIEECIKNYQININICQSRIDIFKDKGLFIPEQGGRLITVALIKENDTDAVDENLTFRMMNSSKLYDGEENYEKHILIPLHFGITSVGFEKIVSNINLK